MPSKVFISYRRDDSNYQARMIHEALSRVLPWEHIFMDVDLIALGPDYFREILRGRVDECDVLLALIGPNWLNATDPKTKGRRLDNLSDFIRIEIGEALARGIPVVPVLIDGVPMPDTDLLPNDLKDLVDIRTRPEAIQGIAKGLIETFPASTFSDRLPGIRHPVQEGRGVHPTSGRVAPHDPGRPLEEVTDVFGFNVRRLLEGCLEARLDLDEDDEEWIRQAEHLQFLTLR